jgi:hypothetical protein
MENNVGLITVRTVILLATAAMLSHAAELGFSWTGARVSHGETAVSVRTVCRSSHLNHPLARGAKNGGS